MPLTSHHLLFTKVGCGKEEIDNVSFDESTVSVLRTIIIRNAFRYVFSKQEIPDIESIRPRTVNPELCAQIDEGRQVWDKAQSEVEQGYK